MDWHDLCPCSLRDTMYYSLINYVILSGSAAINNFILSSRYFIADKSEYANGDTSRLSTEKTTAEKLHVNYIYNKNTWGNIAQPKPIFTRCRAAPREPHLPGICYTAISKLKPLNVWFQRMRDG